ncbi:recombination protein RecR [Candidatus Wolfebacteria bacterium]|nr:recombination protein RecR [Candidatus Wolfebacteria bacterium]
MTPNCIKNFIDVFSGLPGIGPRQATRLAFKLIAGGKNKIEETARAVLELKNLKLCSQCFFIHSGADMLCDICKNPNRKKNIIMIIEKETDIISLERPKKYNGRYLVLGELTKSGILESIQKLRLNNLKTFIAKELNSQAEEIIIATNPTTHGDLNAMIIAKELEGLAKKITRLGRGIPTGGEIEFADEETLGAALERRI